MNPIPPNLYGNAAVVSMGVVALGAAASYLALDAFSGPSSREHIPLTMKSLYLTRYVTEADLKHVNNIKDCIEIRTIPTPVPARNEVLVRMHRSPIHPADIMLMQGMYNRFARPALPHQLGLEGSGVVVQSGGGLSAKKLLDQRVFLHGRGAWSEYVVMPASQCVPLPKDVSLEEGCAIFVNPLSAVALIELAKEGGHKSILHTAAASSIGKMLVRYGPKHGVDIVCVVRHPSEKEELQRLGAKYVIDTSAEEKVWQSELKKACEEARCTLGFEAVGGPLIGQIVACMPVGSTLKVYGGLSGDDVSKLDVIDLIFGDKTVSGFWFGRYLKEQSHLQAAQMTKEALRHLKDDLKFHVADRYTLQEVAEAVVQYASNMSQGKVLIAPTIPDTTS